MGCATIPERLPAFDRINRRAYQQRGVLRQFGAASGWLEPGERLAVELVAEAARDAPVLDIGIGGGRTAPLLRQISADYRGIDYTPAMVAVARRRYPDAVFLEMDARKLAFPDDSFALAVFSYNGIDSIDLGGRRQVLQEVFRVLRPGGCFVFSALNRRNAPAAGHWPDWTVFRDAGRSPAGWLRAIARLLVGGLNRLRRARLFRAGLNVAVGQIAAHNFSLVTLFVSLEEQLKELRSAGFSVEAIFAPDGTPVPVDGAQAGDAPWYNYVVRKPG